MTIDLQYLILVGLAPIIWQIVEWVKIAELKVPAPLVSFVSSFVVAGIYLILPEQVQSLVLACSAIMGGATVMHEGKKFTGAMEKSSELGE